MSLSHIHTFLKDEIILFFKSRWFQIAIYVDMYNDIKGDKIYFQVFVRTK